MDLNPFVDKPMLAALKRLLPDVIFAPIFAPVSGSKTPSVSIELPAAVGAEYLFKLYFQPERQISARLLRLNTQYYFWYRPFDDAEFGNSADRLDKAFIETVEELVTSETRIIQKRGLLTHSFMCDYKSPSAWKRVYSHSALRLGGFEPPPIAGRQHIYHSPALVAR